MAKPYNDKKFRLGEPLATMLKDYCAANHRAAAVDVIRDAVMEFIQTRNKDPGMRARYDKARRERLELPDKIAQLVPKNGNGK